MQLFTDEKFEGYEFRCYTASANTGFKHVCDVYKDNNIISDCTSIVNWGNRTWEPYQYASVFEESKDRLQDFLNGVKKPEVDYDFLEKLVYEDVIADFGDMETGETVILMHSWEQVEGEEERTYVEGEGMVKTGRFIKSPYAKLRELAEKGLLKPSVSSTILNIDYVFTDEYGRCDECGTVHNICYGDLTYVEEEGMMLCDKCVNSPDRIEPLIENAKEDFRQALKPTVDQELIEDLGYSLVTTDTFSFDREFWGATYVSTDFVDEFIHKFDGFVQIYEVAQFVCPFQIWVPTENLDAAKEDMESHLK